jgi:hypothetical protein
VILLALATAVAALGAGGYWVLRYWVLRPQAPNPDAVWVKAEEDFLAGRYEPVVKALALLGRLREPTPLDWFLRAQMAMLRELPDEAIADLTHVPEDYKQGALARMMIGQLGARARMMIGQLELRRDRARLAEKALRTAVRIDPTLVKAHRELVFIYGVQLRRDELNVEFQALSEYSELKFEEAFHWCMLRNDSWEPLSAAQMLEKYVAADPDDRWSRLALAENKRRMGLLDEADSLLAGLSQNDPEAIAARARILVDRNEEERAERLLALGPPDDPVLARLRGRLALFRRQGRLALHHFQIAYTADPYSREALFGLLSSLVLLGDEKAAAPYRQQVAARERLGTLIQIAATDAGHADPKLPRQLGAACAALHWTDEARAWYKLAIARNPVDHEAQRALSELNAEAPRPDRSGVGTPGADASGTY